MPAVADIVVQAPDRTTQLVVEAKNKVPASSDWAARMRRNLFAHLRLPQAPFFLLALPERFYLWKNAPPLEAVPPHYEIDAQQILRPYLEKLHALPADLSETSLELIVRSWLEDVMNSDPARLMQSHKWLISSGLYDAIKSGSIRRQMAL